MGKDSRAGCLHPPDIRVLTDGRGPFATVLRDDEHLVRRKLGLRGLPFGVARAQAWSVGLNPDLDEMQTFGLGGIVFAVTDSAAGAHDLDLARSELGMVAQAVAMLNHALQNVGEDLHVSVAVRREAHGGGDDVLIDDPQRPEAHVGRVMVVGEAEAVPRHEPTMVGEAPLGRTPDLDAHPSSVREKPPLANGPGREFGLNSAHAPAQWTFLCRAVAQSGRALLSGSRG